MIGAIFDFTKNSSEFLALITNVLSQIVVSKEFLMKLGEQDKRQALELILKPSETQLEQCSNIEDYFKKNIQNSMEMFNTDFKTNLVIQAKAFKEDGKVVVQGVMTNRIYKLNDTYSPIFTTFERDDCTVLKTVIIHPQGEKNAEVIEEEEHGEQIVSNEKLFRKYKLIIPPQLQSFPYLTVRREFREEGFDHWTNFHWTSLTPCDGIVFHIQCEDNLIIKDHLIFDDKKLYNITKNDTETEMDIVSVSWLNRYTGFTLTISEKNNLQNA